MRSLVVLALLVSPALAKEVAPPDPVDYVPIAAHANLDGATAMFTLRYVIDVSETGFARDLTMLQLPRGGVVTSASAAVDGAVHKLALDFAEQADATFEDIAKRTGTAHRRWAIHLAVGHGGDSVTVQVAAPHRARIAITLEVSAPTCFVNEVRYVSVPKTWAPAVDRGLARTTVPATLDASCSTQFDGEHLWLGLDSHELAAKPFGEQRLGMAAGRLDLQHDHIAHVELDLANQITQVPPDLATVFVIDGSYSMTSAQSEAQQALIQSYVRLAPRSRVQIVEFDRKAHALLPSWMPASEAAKTVTRVLGALPGANGSNIDVGIAEAGKWLARVDGTRRIVVFTDQLVAARFDDVDAATWRTGLPDGTLVHVVALETGHGTSSDRDDDVMFASLAKVTEGISIDGRADDNGKANAAMLVRPMTLDHVAMIAPGWTGFDVETMHTCRFEDATFEQGTSCEWWGHGDASAGPIKIEGQLWNHKVVRVLRPDPSEGRKVAREASALGTPLGDEVTAEIDRAALAINAVWSMLGTWGGGDGYADLDTGRFGFGTSGCGCGGGSSSDSIGIGRIGTISHHLDLKTQLENAIGKCGRDGRRVQIDLELTRDEIVAVGVATDPALRDCVTEAVWDTAIALGNAPSHSHVSVVLD